MSRNDLISILNSIGYSVEKARALGDDDKTCLYEQVKKIIFQRTSSYTEYTATIKVLCDLLEY